MSEVYGPRSDEAGFIKSVAGGEDSSVVLKKRVAVIFGGRSGEHEISVQSALSVMGALDREKYEVVPVGITREGKWLAGIDPPALLTGDFRDAVTVNLPADPAQKGLVGVSPAKAGAEIPVLPVDVFFPVLHGTFGEDGTVQGLLELANVPYVGAGVLASALGMDKVLMKTVFARHDIPQPRFWFCLRREWERDRSGIVAGVEERLGYPCFVKPANLGSSVGISKAHDRAELVRAIDLAAKYDRKIILEEGVDVREVEVSVLGNDEPVASPPGEIIPFNEFYDYEAKYIDGKSSLVIPADLPPDTVKRIQELAVEVFKAVDCAGMARVDFFVTRRNGAVLVNEINTIPGFTRFSMYPKLWEAGGIGYSELLDRLIGLALERHREKNRSLTVFQLEEN
ncbi:MAG: D-alanine--D-alanine ligase [Peptococcaceae bacterium]|jgi:D-alanine-D-alanine ligase|nr:MAG: D-alanine--D-alanine ligase [Peptococcaceae bacterium]